MLCYLNMSSREAGNEVWSEDGKRPALHTTLCPLFLLTDDPNFGGTVNDFVSFSQREK